MCLLVVLIAGTSQTGTLTSNSGKQDVGKGHDHPSTPYATHNYANVIPADTTNSTHNHRHGAVHQRARKSNSDSLPARWSNDSIYKYLLCTSNENNTVTHLQSLRQPGDYPTSVSVDQDVNCRFGNLQDTNANIDAVYAEVILTNRWTLRMPVYRSQSITSTRISNGICYLLLWALAEILLSMASRAYHYAATASTKGSTNVLPTSHHHSTVRRWRRNRPTGKVQRQIWTHVWSKYRKKAKARATVIQPAGSRSLIRRDAAKTHTFSSGMAIIAICGYITCAAITAVVQQSGARSTDTQMMQTIQKQLWTLTVDPKNIIIQLQDTCQVGKDTDNQILAAVQTKPWIKTAKTLQRQNETDPGGHFIQPSSASQREERKLRFFPRTMDQVPSQETDLMDTHPPRRPHTEIASDLIKALRWTRSEKSYLSTAHAQTNLRQVLSRSSKQTQICISQTYQAPQHANPPRTQHTPSALREALHWASGMLIMIAVISTLGRPALARHVANDDSRYQRHRRSPQDKPSSNASSGTAALRMVLGLLLIAFAPTTIFLRYTAVGYTLITAVWRMGGQVPQLLRLKAQLHLVLMVRKHLSIVLQVLWKVLNISIAVSASSCNTPHMEYWTRLRMIVPQRDTQLPTKPQYIHKWGGTKERRSKLRGTTQRQKIRWLSRCKLWIVLAIMCNMVISLSAGGTAIALEIGPEIAQIMVAAASAITVASLGSSLSLQAVAGVTQAVGQNLVEELLTTSDPATFQELAAPLQETPKGTASAKTPDPYRGQKTDLFHWPNTDQECPLHPLRTVDTETNLIMGEQQAEYGPHWQKMRELLIKFNHCFAFSIKDLAIGMQEPTGKTLEEIGLFPALPFDIELQEGREGQGCYDRERPLSPMEWQAREEHLKECEENHIIEPASNSSKFSIAWVIAAKKDLQGEWTDKRCCLDARRLNAMSVDNNYRTQTLDQIFARMEGAKYFCSLDAKSGYNQVHLTEAAKEKSTFMWNGKPYRFTRAWFGAKAMPGHFQALMDHLMKGLKVGIYLDDLLCYASSPSEMVHTMEQVLLRCENVGLKLHPKKSVFATAFCEFLGHMVSPGKLTPAAAKTRAFEALQPPKDVSELRSAVGLFQYYRCYDPMAGQLVEPMTTLLRKEHTTSRIPFAQQWGPKQAACFEQMKRNLTRNGLAVRHADPDRPFKVHVDFSKHGLGAILAQDDDDGKEYVVSCISRTLNSAERNYSSFQGEMLGVCWALRTFRGYLYGVPFDVYTDHKPLVWLQHNYQLSGKHARWFMTIQDLTFRLIHRAGRDHVDADFLSRYALKGDFDPSGARQDFCAEPATISSTNWDLDTMTVKLEYLDLAEKGKQEMGHTIAENGHPMVTINNPAQAYMGMRRMTGEAEYLTAILKGTTEEACTRHAATKAESDPDISQCFQTQVLTAFHFSAASDMFQESQFDSLEGYTADDVNRSIQGRHQEATRWVVRANMQGMYVSPDSAFKWNDATNHSHPIQDCDRILDTRVVGHHWMHRAHEHGVVVIDLFGGMGAMLEGVLRMNLKVIKYYHCDNDPIVNQIIEHRIAALMLQFPGQLESSAITGTFDLLPSDANQITHQHLAEIMDDTHESAIFIGAGTPCQDLSSASGKPKGLKGQRSILFYTAVDIIIKLQQLAETAGDDVSRVGYMMENVSMQHGHNNQEQLMKDYCRINDILGKPVTFDAATMGSYAHRLRNWWTNLGDPTQLQLVVDLVDRDQTRVVKEILHPHHSGRLATHDDRAPYEPCNVTGFTLRALPTLMATPQSHAFRPGRHGSLLNTVSNMEEEPDAVERERAMGYLDGSTAAPGVTEAQRRKVLGNTMDQRALSGLLTICVVLPLTKPSGARFAAHQLRKGIPPALADTAVVHATAGDTLHPEEERHMQGFADAETKQDWYQRTQFQEEPATGWNGVDYDKPSKLEMGPASFITQAAPRGSPSQPDYEETVTYHFPMHPMAIIAADKVMKQARNDCPMPDTGNITAYDHQLTRQELTHGPTSDTDFREAASMAPRTNKQLKEKYAQGYQILAKDDYINGRPLGLYARGHAWPLDPSKMAKRDNCECLGSGYQPPRDGTALRFVRAADDSRPVHGAGPTTLMFKSVPMTAPATKPRQRAILSPTQVPNEEWCRTDTPYSGQPDQSWVHEELLHDIALSGDSCLSCVSSAQAAFAPSLSSSTRTQFAKDPGGSSLDPWEDANLLRCLRGTPVHQISSDVTEQQRTAGRLSAYALDVKNDNVERLYRKVLDGSHREVPPPANRLTLARQIHTECMHLGVRRTQQLAMRQWYWYKLRQDIKLVVNTCTACARRNLAFTADDPELHSLPIKELGYRWSTDMLKLPTSDRGFCRCMVCVEHLSRFIIVIPLYAKSAFDAALAFKLHVIGVFGLMAEVVTDQGTEFAADFHNMLVELGIDHRQTSPYRPQGNGLSERIVQVVKKAINKKVAEINGHNQWEMFVPMIALAYNTSVQESTKLSPSTVMMAQLPIVPPQSKRLFNETLVIGDTSGEQIIAGADLLRRSELVNKAGIYALSGLQAAQHRDTKRYATTHSGNYARALLKVHAGDFVYVYRKPKNVLDTKTRDPILKVLSVNSFHRATLQGRNGKTTVRHVKNLAPCPLPNIIDTLDENALDEIHEAVRCYVCNGEEDEDVLLMCDGGQPSEVEFCDRACHTFCCDPELMEVPEDEWFCNQCSAKRTHAVPGARALPRPPDYDGIWPAIGTPLEQLAAVAKPKRGTYSICGKCYNCLRPRNRQRCLQPIMVTPVDTEVIQTSSPVLDPSAESFVPATTETLNPPAEHRRSTRLQRADTPVVQTSCVLEELISWIPEDWTSALWHGIDNRSEMNNEAVAEWVNQAMPGHYSTQHTARLMTHLQSIQTAVRTMDSCIANNLTGTVEFYPQSNGTEKRKEVIRRSKLQLGLKTVVTMPSEVHSLLQILDIQELEGVYDLWSGTGTIAAVMAEAFVEVHSSDWNPHAVGEQADALSTVTYQRLKGLPGGLQAIVSSPDFSVIDIAVALAVAAVDVVACLHVPGDYMSNAHTARIDYLVDLRAQGRVMMIQCLPKGPTGRSNMWLVVFKNGVGKSQYIRDGFNRPIMFTEHVDTEGAASHRAMVWEDVMWDDPPHNKQQIHTQNFSPLAASSR